LVWREIEEEAKTKREDEKEAYAFSLALFCCPSHKTSFLQ
jgi:hypothetical protein